MSALAPMKATAMTLAGDEVSRWGEHFKAEILAEYPEAAPTFLVIEDPRDKGVTMGPKLSAEVTVSWGPEKKVLQFMPEIPECWDPVLSECLDWLDAHADRLPG